jgi:hypothetical protein
MVELARKAKELRTNGPCYTVMTDKDEIIACGGVVLLWPGVAEAWALTSDLVAQYALAFHRISKVTVSSAIQFWKLHRVQAVVHSRHEVSQRWVKRLGFKREAILTRYGADQSQYIMYALLPGE